MIDWCFPTVKYYYHIIVQNIDNGLIIQHVYCLEREIGDKLNFKPSQVHELIKTGSELDGNLRYTCARTPFYIQ